MNKVVDSRKNFKKYSKLIVAIWLILALISYTQLNLFFSNVSYNITNISLSQMKNAMSTKADELLKKEFPSMNKTSDILLIVIQSNNVYSNDIKYWLFNLNQSLSKDPKIKNFTNIQDIYTIEEELFKSVFNATLKIANKTSEIIKNINYNVYLLKNNITKINQQIFFTISTINGTSNTIYGIPELFIKIWIQIYNQTNGGHGNVYLVNYQANSTILSLTNNFSGNIFSLSYYTLFFKIWNESFQKIPYASLNYRLSWTVNNTIVLFLNNPNLNNETKNFVKFVANNLNLSDWNNASLIINLSLNYVASFIPKILPFNLTNLQFVNLIYDLGKNPTESGIKNLTISLFKKEIKNYNLTGYSLNSLIEKSYELGENATYNKIWNLTSIVATNITKNLFQDSPLFYINNDSLYNALLKLNSTCCINIENYTLGIIMNYSYYTHPLILKYNAIKNFVSSDNSTMVAILNFNSTINTNTLNETKKIVETLHIKSNATVYITGSSIISEDTSKSFSEALDVSRFVGTLVSMLVVGLLFLSPITAIIPYIVAGIAIIISYPLIYYLVVVVGHSQLTFLTPVLTTLLMLGLAIDYSVLQLRRTREEMSSGKSKDESVTISMKWAGQAILTAGITVIVSYVIMSVSNIPLFGDIGYSIAIGVAVLLAASLTLLPALEYIFGEKLYWPNKNYRSIFSRTKILNKVSKLVISKKTLIIVIVLLIALGSFYVSLNTPTSMDLIKTVPNFKSIQAINIIDDKIGSGSIQPTYLLIQTKDPIIYANGSLNYKVFNQIDALTNLINKSNGVSFVISPSQPYGEKFNYSNINNLQDPIKIQYINKIESLIGKDNHTALIYVWLNYEATSKEAINVLNNIENKITKVLVYNSTEFNEIISMYYGGSTQATFDSEQLFNKIIPQVILTLSLAVLLILFIQLRSLITPLRLILTILISISISLSLLYVLFYNLYNYPVVSFIPLFVAVTMLGVGIDYDIFYVTRVREIVINGKSDKEAVVEAVNKVSGTLIGLGLIFASVFASVIISDIIIMREIGFVVSSAIIIDTSAMLLFFVPAIMGLAEKYNWWPSKIKKIQQ